MRSLMRSALLAVSASLVTSTAAQALPILQLDILGGHYDATTQTVIAGSNPFTLVAIFTPPPNLTPAQLAGAFAEDVYISAAVSPGYGPGPGNLGSFKFDGQTIDVTNDMTYGTPPVESGGFTQGYDSGDLAPHDIFPTYFREFTFNFDPNNRTTSYNTRDNTGGLDPNPNGESYFATFAVDTRLLDPRYVIHFDMYNEKYLQCARTPTSCTDVDIDRFAPFSKDAESAPVPEPATLLLLGSGVVAGAVRKRRQRQSIASA